MRLGSLPGESAMMIMLRAVKATLVIVHRMCEFGMRDEIRPLEEQLRGLALSSFERHAVNGGTQGVTALSRAQRLALFEILNNLAVLDIHKGDVLSAKHNVMQAASLLRDDDPYSDIFLLNTASLIVGDRDGKEKEAEALMLRAREIAQQRFNKQAEEVEEAREKAEEAKAALDKAQLAVGEGAAIPLPGQGRSFWVHVEDGLVENRETSREEVGHKAAEEEVELAAREKVLMKRRIAIMRCCRKLGNLYRRGWRNRDKWGAARRMTTQLLAEAAVCGPMLPLKDLLANAAFLVDYHITTAVVCKASSDKKAGYARARDTALEAVLRCSVSMGSMHTYKRSSELYEKAAVGLLLCRDPPMHAVDLALTAVRIRTANEKELHYQTARALRTVSECLAAQGELDQAMAVALSASDMAADCLGEKHFKAKAIRKLYVEHKKVYLKCGSVGMGKEASRDMARRMTMSRIDTKQWIEEWLGV